VKTGQAETPERAYRLFADNEIKINRSLDVLFGEKKNYTFDFIYESLNNVDSKRVLALIWGWGSQGD
jgi:hypothetical protein